MIKKNNLELIEIPYSKLLKLELPEFAERVIEIAERHDPEALQIKEIYDLLVAQKVNINKLDVTYRAHPLTEQLSNLRDVRTIHVRAIELQLKLVIKQQTRVTSEPVALLKIEINRFLGGLRSCKNDQSVSRKITLFFQQVASNTELSEALTSLNFTELLANLELVHSKIWGMTIKRSSSKSGRPKEKTAQLVYYVLTATKNLIKQIEIAPLKHTDIDYEPLYNELNQVLIEYRDVINKRVLFNLSKAEKIKNGENSESNEITQPDDTTQQTESAGRMMHLNADEVNMNELDTEQVEIKKAAAMSSKDMQLPLIDENEADKKQL